MAQGIARYYKLRLLQDIIKQAFGEPEPKSPQEKMAEEKYKAYEQFKTGGEQSLTPYQRYLLFGEKPTKEKPKELPPTQQLTKQATDWLIQSQGNVESLPKHQQAIIYKVFPHLRPQEPESLLPSALEEERVEEIGKTYGSGAALDYMAKQLGWTKISDRLTQIDNLIRRISQEDLSKYETTRMLRLGGGGLDLDAIRKMREQQLKDLMKKRDILRKAQEEGIKYVEQVEYGEKYKLPFLRTSESPKKSIPGFKPIDEILGGQ